MRVAQDNLGTHIYQLVDEEQTALEHLLMYQYRAASLSSHYDEHRKEVRCESRPRCICQSQNGAVDERVDDVVRLTWDEEVVALYFYLNAQSAECVWNDTKLTYGTILDAYAVAHHCCHTDERAYLNHVRQNTVFGTMQRLDTYDGNQV